MSFMFVFDYQPGGDTPRKDFRFGETALCCPDGGAKKGVFERKSRLQEAPGARKLLFRTADQPEPLWVSFL
jgi:hypothetical protein